MLSILHVPKLVLRHIVICICHTHTAFSSRTPGSRAHTGPLQCTCNRWHSSKTLLTVLLVVALFCLQLLHSVVFTGRPHHRAIDCSRNNHSSSGDCYSAHLLRSPRECQWCQQHHCSLQAPLFQQKAQFSVQLVTLQQSWKALLLSLLRKLLRKLLQKMLRGELCWPKRGCASCLGWTLATLSYQM
jgi:hypothetical protein